MIIDLHTHTIGEHRDNFISPSLTTGLAFRLFARRFELAWNETPKPEILKRIGLKVNDWLRESVIDRAVMLALDAPYLLNGERDTKNVRVIVSNDFVADLAEKNEKILFGASIHPYRKDALQELERVIALGACLIKWLPGAQNIEPDHPQCFPFYEALAHYRMPLLCHTGCEHVLKMYPNTFNDPRRLEPALKRGVTVIAAHCGTRIFPHEQSYFSAWRELALEYENMYGDLGAFIIWGRLRPLQKILSHPLLVRKLVFGSDFPAWHFPLHYVTKIGFSSALQLRKVANPFDQAIAIFKAAGVPDSVFSRGESLLYLR